MLQPVISGNNGLIGGSSWTIRKLMDYLRKERGHPSGRNLGWSRGNRLMSSTMYVLSFVSSKTGEGFLSFSFFVPFAARSFYYVLSSSLERSSIWRTKMLRR